MEEVLRNTVEFVTAMEEKGRGLTKPMSSVYSRCCRFAFNDDDTYGM